MEIKIPKYKDATKIAILHKTEISSGFISSLKLKVVKKLYEVIIENEIIFVLKDDEKLIGFISCALNTKKLYKNFIRKNLFAVAPYFIVNIFSIKFLKKIFETLKAPYKTKIDKEKMPELLSIVVDSTLQAKGLGKLLLNELEKKLLNLNIKKYKVVAGDNLFSANKFYLKNNFKLADKIQLHKGQISNLYYKKI